MNCLTKCICTSCAIWILFYIVYGATSTGREWFQVSVANGNKSAVPMLTISIPILIAGSSCAMLLLLLTNSGIIMESGGDNNNSKRRRQRPNKNKNGQEHYISTLPHQLPSWIHQSWHFIATCSSSRRIAKKMPSFCCCFRGGGRGDVQMGVIAIVFLTIPLCIYTACTIHRHLSNEQEMSFDDQLKEISNALGIAATIAISIVLIPVSRHSPLLQLMSFSNWSPAHAIYLHHVSGRLVVVGGLLHGCIHIYRWIVIQGQDFMIMIIPPSTCWTINGNNNDNTNDDSCYKNFRNLTGILAGLALVVLAVTTTFSWIRRTLYHVFWTCHVIAAPIVFIMVILHYEKAILYVAGGVLYYLASTVPVQKELLLMQQVGGNGGGGVPIVAVQRIPAGCGATNDADATTTDCIMSVTIQVDPVALERFRAGHYVRLLAPEISILAHPFTINICPLSLQQNQPHGQDNTTTTNEDGDAYGSSAGGQCCYMQIIFRATGHFTKELAQRLLVNTIPPEQRHTRQRLPVLRLDGFYGPSNRLRTALLEHDVILIVAGGIGITPYLSLLYQLHQNLVTSFRRQAKEDKQQQQSLMLPGSTTAAAADSQHCPFRTKRIVLHWMCRDVALIDYIKREYLSLLMDHDSSTNDSAESDDNEFGIQLVIHQTGISTRRRDTTMATNHDTHNPQDDYNGHNNNAREQAQERVTIAERPVVVGVPFRPSKFAAGTKTSYLANAPLFLSFCLIGWFGLVIIWYCYTHFDSKRQVMPRSYSTVCVLILSLVIAAILNYLFTPAWEDRLQDSCYSAIINDDFDETLDYDEEDTTATVSMQVELARRNGSSALQPTDEEGVLKDPCTNSTDGLLRGAFDDAAFGCGSGNALVTLEERCGRPNVREFLHVFDSNRANYPAVFACGPNDLTRSIRLVVNERHCRMRFCKIAMYQERFEL